MTQIHPKVAAGTAAGAAVVLIEFILQAVGIQVPDEVDAALVVLATFAAGYMKSAA